MLIQIIMHCFPVDIISWILAYRFAINVILMCFQPVDRLADDNIVQAKHVIMLFLAIIEELAP